jgi:hypothetical protein
LSSDSQDCPLLIRQEKRRRPFKLCPQILCDRDRAKVRLNAVGLRNPDQSGARESLVPHPIRRNRRICLSGLKSFQLINEPECGEMKVVERSLILGRMEVGHAPRVQAFVKLVTETGKPGRRRKEKQQAHDDFLQRTLLPEHDHRSGDQHTFKIRAGVVGWLVTWLLSCWVAWLPWLPFN